MTRLFLALLSMDIALVAIAFSPPAATTTSSSSRTRIPFLGSRAVIPGRGQRNRNKFHELYFREIVEETTEEKLDTTGIRVDGERPAAVAVKQSSKNGSKTATARQPAPIRPPTSFKSIHPQISNKINADDILKKNPKKIVDDSPDKASNESHVKNDKKI